MPSFSKVIIVGNLARDAELRYTQNGTAICEICVAINDRWKDKQTGEWQSEVCFIDCTFFGSRAEPLAQYFKKGSPILVEGKLKQDVWEDKQTGERKSKIKIKGVEWQFMESRQDGQPAQPTRNQPLQQPAGGYRQRPPAAPDADRLPQDDSDGLPF